MGRVWRQLRKTKEFVDHCLLIPNEIHNYKRCTMKINFTLCFYEFPGALQEIKQWENLKFNQIIKKYVSKDNVRFYSITLDKEKCNGYEREFLLCFPIGVESVGLDTIDVDEIGKQFQQGVDYYKTIIFGKVNSDDLLKIHNVCRNLENKWTKL